jgi:hypothetical protein
MNLFKQLVQSSPIGNRLKFGYNDNIIITKIDTNERKNKGMVINQNTYITLAKIDPETKKVLAQSEGSYWNLDHKTDYVMQNFIDQFTSIVSIINALGGDVEQFEQEVLSVIPEEFEEIDDYIKTKAGSEMMQKTLSGVAETYIKDKVGENCPLLKCKVTVNKKGFFELGKEQNWILPMDSEDPLSTITAGERRNYRESLKADDKPVEPDKVGTKSEKGVASLKALQGL